MASFVQSSGSISMSDINAVFGLGNSLGNYLGVRWFKADASTGTFSTINLSMDDFYGKGPVSGIPGGSQTFTSSGSFIIPTYSILTVTLRGGAGGGAGGGGTTLPGGTGYTGSASSFGAYGTAYPGSGGGINGIPGTAGAGSDGTPAGGVGGAGLFPGGTGGSGGKNVLTLTNPINAGGTGPAVGSVITVTVGAGGPGGTPGIWIINPGTSSQQTFYGTPGLPGGNGGVVISWS